MKARRSVDPSTFVVRRRDGSDIIDDIDDLRKLGTVELLDGFPDRCLMRPDSTSANAKETWRQLRNQLRPKFEIEPALVDDRGTPSYPTGTITVRFKHTPDDDELIEYEREWGMIVKERNRYIPNQVTFQQEGEAGGRYLPDVVEIIQRSDNRVQAAWLDAISRYERNY
ncbi:MAG: hypothetical protein JSV33_13655 [bacterium]|nr:MAG: hypothetical protein JSV33_13655 [bacterium]